MEKSPVLGKDECVVASHEVLFETSDVAVCDACGAALPDEAAADDAASGASGRGAYLWARGDEIRREEVPLCASCACAIGMSALARWEIEEEEG
jgi:hypothetical protein